MARMERAPLLGMDDAELAAAAAALGLPRYTAAQLAGWVYRRHATAMDEMTDLSRAARAALSERYEVGREPPVDVDVSSDGTRKYLFPAGENAFVETAVIPDRGRATLCLSTQVGCRRACRFCLTGRQGFRANLSAGRILNQYASLPERDTVTNIVYMGMGEPLDNLDAVLRSVERFCAPAGYALSPTRLTVSTIGLLPEVETLASRAACHIALSLHSPFPEERRRLVPAEAAHPVEQVLAALRRARIGGQRRIMIEYVLLRGVNDDLRHAEGLAVLLRGLRCRVNLIPFNPAPGLPWEGTGRAAAERFQAALKERGLWTTIRRSRGRDIAAACGMLSTAGDRPAPGEQPSR